MLKFLEDPFGVDGKCKDKLGVNRVREPGPRLERGSEFCTRLVYVLAWVVLRRRHLRRWEKLELGCCTVRVDEDLVIDIGL